MADRLSTLPAESPRTMREHLVEAIREAIPSHFAMFFRCAKDPDGELAFTDAIFRGDEELRAELSQFVGTPCRALRCPWMPGDVDRGEIDSFIRTRHFYDDDELFSYEAQRRLIRPLEVGEHLRAAFYDGATFVGWIGLIRRGRSERFSAAEERRLEKVAGQLKSGIASANALQADLIGGEASAVFAADGRLAHATEAFVEWMRPSLREYLRRRVGRAERGAIEPAVEISANTVHYHLRNIYDRLGIGSRAELASLMAEEEQRE